MAGSTTDNFFEQILTFPAAAPTAYATGTEGGIPMMLQLSSGNSSSLHGGGGGGARGFHGHGVIKVDGQASGSSKRFGDYGRTSNMKSQKTTGGGRGRVRAKRGQATDPHSIAERLRRERIAERIRALQELVPTINKTDKAVMLDEILDYVKFLQLQVKALRISRMGGAAVPLDIPILSVEEEEKEEEEEEGSEKKSCSGNGIEKQVVKMMEENNIGAAMQFLQSKSLCIMPLFPLPSPTPPTTTTFYRQQQLPIPNQSTHHHPPP